MWRRRDWREGEGEVLKRERGPPPGRVERRRKEEGVGRVQEGLGGCGLMLLLLEEEEEGVLVVVVARGEEVRWTGLLGEKGCGEEVRVVEVASAAAADR